MSFSKLNKYSLFFHSEKELKETYLKNRLLKWAENNLAPDEEVRREAIHESFWTILKDGINVL